MFHLGSFNAFAVTLLGKADCSLVDRESGFRSLFDRAESIIITSLQSVSRPSLEKPNKPGGFGGEVGSEAMHWI